MDSQVTSRHNSLQKKLRKKRVKHPQPFNISSTDRREKGVKKSPRKPGRKVRRAKRDKDKVNYSTYLTKTHGGDLGGPTLESQFTLHSHRNSKPKLYSKQQRLQISINKAQKKLSEVTSTQESNLRMVSMSRERRRKIELRKYVYHQTNTSQVRREKLKMKTKQCLPLRLPKKSKYSSLERTQDLKGIRNLMLTDILPSPVQDSSPPQMPSSRELTNSDRTKCSITEQNQQSISGQQALLLFKKRLTRYEQVEIRKFKEVYFVGCEDVKDKINAPAPSDVPVRPHSERSVSEDVKLSTLPSLAKQFYNDSEGNY